MKPKPIIDTQEFLALSSFLNYQLAGEPINWRGILNFLAEDSLDEASEDFLLEALEYLGEAYGKQKRWLGPLAILHPIRTASLLAQASEEPTTLDLLTALLHDKDEDLTPDQYSEEAWQHLEERYAGLLQKIDSKTNWYLNERIALLAKARTQKYPAYLAHLLDRAKTIPELALVKLADRLDNTLDLRIDLHDFTDRTRSFQVIFDILFVSSYAGLPQEQPHPIARKINGSMRLYQLYKNAVFLSMMREAKVPLDEAAQKLYYSLAVASIREAQIIMMHIFAYHLQGAVDQRAVLLEAMEYAHRDGFECLWEEGSAVLDGLFSRYFVYDDLEMKNRQLAELYKDKKLMALVSVIFLVIFASFINSEDFAIRGIPTRAE